MVAWTVAAALLLVAHPDAQRQQQQQQRTDGPAPSPAAIAADTGAARHSSGRTPPLASAARVGAGSIHLDGRLDETAWARAEPITDFTQTEPLQGTPATERTDVRIVYDDDAVYVGARMFDSDSHGVRTQLARRDAFTEADRFEVAFDAYHDHVTSFVFGVNPSGVRVDRLIGQDGFSSDEGWDPVWAAATRVDSLGWVAELRIPFLPAPLFQRARPDLGREPVPDHPAQGRERPLRVFAAAGPRLRVLLRASARVGGAAAAAAAGAAALRHGAGVAP